MKQKPRVWIVWRKVVRPDREVVDMIESYGTLGRAEAEGTTCDHCLRGRLEDVVVLLLKGG